MTSPTANAVYCDECEELECVHCRDFNARTAAEIDTHARRCPDLPAVDRYPLVPAMCHTCPRFYWPDVDDGGQCFICRIEADPANFVVDPADLMEWPPKPGRFVPPGSRWWCEPAVDLNDRMVGRRVCATCWNAVLTDDYLCPACLRLRDGNR
jgi:hypothetical protein